MSHNTRSTTKKILAQEASMADPRISDCSVSGETGGESTSGRGAEQKQLQPNQNVKKGEATAAGEIPEDPIGQGASTSTAGTARTEPAAPPTNKIPREETTGTSSSDAPPRNERGACTMTGSTTSEGGTQGEGEGKFPEWSGQQLHAKLQAEFGHEPPQGETWRGLFAASAVILARGLELPRRNTESDTSYSHSGRRRDERGEKRKNINNRTTQGDAAPGKANLISSRPKRGDDDAAPVRAGLARLSCVEASQRLREQLYDVRLSAGSSAGKKLEPEAGIATPEAVNEAASGSNSDAPLQDGRAAHTTAGTATSEGGIPSRTEAVERGAPSVDALTPPPTGSLRGQVLRTEKGAAAPEPVASGSMGISASKSPRGKGQPAGKEKGRVLKLSDDQLHAVLQAKFGDVLPQGETWRNLLTVSADILARGPELPQRSSESDSSSSHSSRKRGRRNRNKKNKQDQAQKGDQPSAAAKAQQEARRLRAQVSELQAKAAQEAQRRRTQDQDAALRRQQVELLNKLEERMRTIEADQRTLRQSNITIQIPGAENSMNATTPPEVTTEPFTNSAGASLEEIVDRLEERYNRNRNGRGSTAAPSPPFGTTASTGSSRSSRPTAVDLAQHPERAASLTQLSYGEASLRLKEQLYDERLTTITAEEEERSFQDKTQLLRDDGNYYRGLPPPWRAPDRPTTPMASGADAKSKKLLLDGTLEACPVWRSYFLYNFHLFDLPVGSKCQRLLECFDMGSAFLKSLRRKTAPSAKGYADVLAQLEEEFGGYARMRAAMNQSLREIHNYKNELDFEAHKEMLQTAQSHVHNAQDFEYEKEYQAKKNTQPHTTLATTSADSGEETPAEEAEDATATKLFFCASKNRKSLRTLTVLLETPDGRESKANAVLDDGSMEEMLDTNVAKRLRLKGFQTNFGATGIGGTSHKHSRAVITWVKVSSPDRTYSLTIPFIVIPNLTGGLQAVDWNKHEYEWDNLRNIQFQEVTEGPVGILIGGGWPRLQDSLEERPGKGHHSPGARLTHLGWTAFGPVSPDYELKLGNKEMDERRSLLAHVERRAVSYSQRLCRNDPLGMDVIHFGQEGKADESGYGSNAEPAEEEPAKEMGNLRRAFFQMNEGRMSGNGGALDAAKDEYPRPN